MQRAFSKRDVSLPAHTQPLTFQFTHGLQAIDLVYEAPLAVLRESVPLFNLTVRASVVCPPGTQDRNLSQQATVDAFLGAASLPGSCTLPSPADDALTCVPCPPGHFRNGSSMAAGCEACPRGSYAPGLGQLGCIACAPGISDVLQGTRARQSSPFRVFFTRHPCLSPPPGSAVNQTGSEVCPVCEPGSFATGNGSFTCDLCMPGTSQPLPGQRACVNCTSGNAQVRVKRSGER
jgi:hypothetical protein